jgi:hypothetical protein
MNNESVVRDERTMTVENASYRWAYHLLSFGLLLDVAYRGVARNESSWDLLALVIVTGLAATLYQQANKILSRRWALTAVVTAVAAAVIAAAIVFLR